MKKYFRNIFIAILAIFWGTSSIQAQNVNMDRYITLTVKEGASILLDIWADAAGTPVKIVSGSEEQTITVDSAWTSTKYYVAKAGTMMVYGDVLQFNCGDNTTNVTGLDISHNARLQGLFCTNNSLTTLDVSKNTELIWLYCYENSLVTLDVSRNTKLKGLRCYSNSLTSLDLHNNTELMWLYCQENSLSSLNLHDNTQLTFLDCHANLLTSLDVSKSTKITIIDCGTNRLSSLDISNNTELEWLYCFENSLTALDVSRNPKLNSLHCHDNKFTAVALDDIYCSLPNRKKEDMEAGVISPIRNVSSPDKDKVLATNGNNAIAKNWKIQYYEEIVDITDFTGTHQCTSGIDEVENVPSFTVYPNPIKDILHVTSDKPVHSIRIYDMYGAEVLHATDVTSINVSQLPVGVYMVRVDGKVTRVIKE